MDPSNCLTSVPIFDAIYSITSSGISFSKFPAIIFGTETEKYLKYSEKESRFYVNL